MKQKLSKLEKIKIAFNLFLMTKNAQSHERENARRRKQIEKGIIHISTLILLLCSFPALASESSSLPVKGSLGLAPQEFESSKGIIPSIPVTIEVEDKGVFWDYSHSFLPIGSTASDALESTHRVTHGRVCLDPEGVVAVDGIKYYWMVSVNGDIQNVNAHTILKSGDKVRWWHVSPHRNPDHL